MPVTNRCVGCHNDSLEFFGNRLDYQYYTCKICGTLQLTPHPTPEELNAAYEDDYASAEHYQGDPVALTKAAYPYYQQVVETLQRYVTNGKIVDFGAGWGGMTQMLIDLGYDCIGIDPSKDMVQYATEVKNLPLQHGDIHTLLEQDRKFDAFVLCTVFEHLVEHDKWMQQASDLLNPGGYIVTLQPTAGFARMIGNISRLGNKQKPLAQLHQIFAPPWHTTFFSEQGASLLAQRNGFELVETLPAPQGQRDGMLGIAQSTLGFVNQIGTGILGHRWPLVVAHTFVFRKIT